MARKADASAMAAALEEEGGMGGGSEEESMVAETGVDGAEEEEVLSKSMVLSRAEVVKRRRRRVRQLMKLYRAHYWALLDELRSKYRRFYLLTGKSGWKDQDNGSINDDDDVPQQDVANLKCASPNCKLRPMPLSHFCFSHILSDPKQCLYTPCTFVVRSGANPNCGKPVLRAVSPTYCAVHLQLAQKQAARVRRATNSLPPLGTIAGKGAPKLHVVISEYVRVIQAKRRASAATRLATS